MASDLIVPVAEIKAVNPHPNADRLELVEVLGWQLVSEKGLRKVGQRVVYFAPDTLLPAEWAEKWNIRQYLKGKDKNRVGQIRLRGEPSMGFISAIPEGQDWEIGENVADFFGAKKYNPPTRTQGHGGGGGGPSDALPDHPLLQKYTDIQNLRHYPELFLPDEEVSITEKIHGSNVRMGWIEGHRVAASMKINRSMPKRYVRKSSEALKEEGIELPENVDLMLPPRHSGKLPKAMRLELRDLELKMDQLYDTENCDIDDKELAAHWYWFPWTIPAIREMLAALVTDFGEDQILLYGEVYGPSIQGGFHYEVPSGELAFRAFDLLVRREYFGVDKFFAICKDFGVETVPELYRGPYTSIKKVKEICDGNTAFGSALLREGGVVKPLIARTNPKIGRLVLKYCTDDYLLSKHTDYTDV